MADNQSSGVMTQFSHGVPTLSTMENHRLDTVGLALPRR
jgi:hypothetical protein